VVFVDHFGNLITNIPGEAVAEMSLPRVAGRLVPRRVRTYADAAPGELVALAGSDGLLEIAVVGGSAARQLGAGVGAAVEVPGP
jgi:S-adenosylmethionine hydrolase